MNITTGFILFFIILAVAAFFVMSEFVLVRIRPSRLDFLIENGDKKAELLRTMTLRLDTYLSATQLGITITSLALGWLGDSTFKRIFDSLFASFAISERLSTILSFVISFAILTAIQVIIGELIPKNIAITKTEKMGMKIARPLSYWYKIMYPFVFILNKAANGISKTLGLTTFAESDDNVSEEELRLIMSESLKSGEINYEEYQFVENVFNFDERMAREIMVPRTDMAVVWADDTLEDIGKLIQKEKYTRYPVVDGDKDNILGVINAKEIFGAYVAAAQGNTTDTFNIHDYLRPVITIIETLPIKDLLFKMQKERHQIAILVDEYGGTSGLVSMEDIVEEIVGDISDEYETEEIPDYISLDQNHFRLSGRMLIDDVNDVLGLDLEEDTVDTIGGWILNQKYDIAVGEEVTYKHVLFKVIQKDKNSIEAIDVFLDIQEETDLEESNE